MIKKIVLTGGPCAGKTTSIKAIKKHYSEKGFKVICIPETATELIDNGIDFKTYNDTIVFQDIILKKQLFKEELYQNAAELQSNENILLIYDRGICDNIAYLEKHSDFDKIAKENNVNELKALDNYDLIINLITTADCNPEIYKTSETRKEDPQQAIALDRKTSNAWAGHRNIKIINTSTTIEEEILTIEKYIDNLINREETKQIQTFELHPRKTDITNYNDNNSRLIKTTDIYLENKNDNTNYIISMREYKGNYNYIFTITDTNNSITTTYYDKVLTENEALKKISNSRIKNIIKKVDIYFVEERQLFDIQIIKDKMNLLVEENKLNNGIKIPNNIVLKDEYNNEKEYQKVRKYDNIM